MAKTNYEIKKTSNERYAAKMEIVSLRVPKGRRDIWKQAAAGHGKSLAQYLTDLVYADNPDLFPEKEVSSGDK
ncbi:MAG: hypothetical protein Q4D42_10630 [Eubacteriales bacterium]|nr:hypothetical protein [Eubacteriales bacterium]